MFERTETEIKKNWPKTEDITPIVTVRMNVYNHEKYLKQALDSVLIQVTDFPFEIIVHDDASTDNSATILKEYEQKYPSIIKPIYQQENQYSKDPRIIAKTINKRTRGKYVAYCEGDDFWCDEKKLQEQYNLMEKNQEASFCTHFVSEVNPSGEDNGISHPKKPFDLSEVNLQNYLDCHGYVFQTSSFFVRRSLLEEYYKLQLAFRDGINIGDRPLCLFLLTRGNCCFIKKTMSCYRRFVPGGWSDRTHNNNNKKIRYYEQLVKMMEAFDNFTNYQYDCHVERYKWDYYFASKQYHRLGARMYRDILSQYNYKFRIFIHLCYRLPVFERLLSLCSLVNKKL